MLMFRASRRFGVSTSSKMKPCGRPPSNPSMHSTCSESVDWLEMEQFCSGNGRPIYRCVRTKWGLGYKLNKLYGLDWFCPNSPQPNEYPHVSGRSLFMNFPIYCFLLCFLYIYIIQVTSINLRHTQHAILWRAGGDKKWTQFLFRLMPNAIMR